jgi:DNA polymerase III delta prime subunit
MSNIIDNIRKNSDSFSKTLLLVGTSKYYLEYLSRQIAWEIEKKFIDRTNDEYITIKNSIFRGENIDILESDTNTNSITVDQIHSLIEHSEIRPVRLNYKIIIIRQAELLTLQASNSLLKNIEEPSSSNIWILCTNNESKIISTIRSRSRIIDAYSIPREFILSCLKEKFLGKINDDIDDKDKAETQDRVSEENINEALVLTHNNLDYSIELLRNKGFLDFQKKLNKKSNVTSVYEAYSNAKSIMDFIIDLAPNDKIKQKQLLRIIISNLMVYYMQLDNKKQSSKLILSTEKALGHLSTNVPTQLLLESMFCSY